MRRSDPGDSELPCLIEATGGFDTLTLTYLADTFNPHDHAGQHVIET